MTEDDWIEHLGARTPVERVKLRRGIRSMKLQMKLMSSEAPDPLVLATSDGRTLTRGPSRGLQLDIGDDPQHWSEKDAAQVLEQWNRDALPKDHVTHWAWRDFYALRIKQLNAPL